MSLKIPKNIKKNCRRWQMGVILLDIAFNVVFIIVIKLKNPKNTNKKCGGWE
jgi:hypothetical protein